VEAVDFAGYEAELPGDDPEDGDEDTEE